MAARCDREQLIANKSASDADNANRVLFEHQLDEETIYENVDRAGKVLGGVLYKIAKERKTSDARGQSALTEKLSGAALFVWNSLARIVSGSEANRKFQWKLFFIGIVEVLLLLAAVIFVARIVERSEFEAAGMGAFVFFVAFVCGASALSQDLRSTSTRKSSSRCLKKRRNCY